MIEKYFINNQLGIKFNWFIDRKCRVRFKAKDVVEILGYSKPRNAIERNVSKNHKMIPLCWGPETGRQQKDKKGCPPETGGQQNDTRGSEMGASKRLIL